MKKINKILSIVLAVVMLFTAVSRVKADNYDNYDAVNGGEFQFAKYLVTNVGAENPDAEFTFKITSGISVNATENTVKQIAGPTPNLIKISHGVNTIDTHVIQGEAKQKTDLQEAYREFSVKFFSTDEPTANYGREAKGENHGGEVAVRKNIKLDFSEVVFSEPGVYRYIIQEVSSSNPDVDMDEKPYRTLDVYVEDAGNNELAVTSYVFYENDLGSNAANNDSEFNALDKFDISASGIRNEIWTELKDVDYTYTYDQVTQKWNAAGSPAKTGEISVPGSATCDEVEHDYEHARNNGIDVTQYQWKNTEQVSYVYTWDDTNKYWQDNCGRTNLTVPSNASNGTTTYSEFYEAKFNEQKAAWDALKHNDVVTYPDGNGAEAGTKTDKYVNEYLRYNLVVKKEVTGNQGSKDQFFKFVIEIDSGVEHKNAVITLESPLPNDSSEWINSSAKPNNATEYTKGVIYAANSRDDDRDMTLNDVANEEEARKYVWSNRSVPTTKYYWDEENGTWIENRTSDSATTNVQYVNIRKDSFYTGEPGQQIILNDSGKNTITLYLQNAEQAKLLNLPTGTKYKVTEAESNKDGYTTTGEVTTLTELKDITKTYKEVTEDLNLDVTDYEFTDEDGNEYYYGSNGWTMKPADGSSEVPGSTVPDTAKTTVYTETVKVVNDRNGVIPTGVFVAAGTGFAILGAGIVGMLALSRRKEEDEDEE